MEAEQILRAANPKAAGSSTVQQKITVLRKKKPFKKTTTPRGMTPNE